MLYVSIIPALCVKLKQKIILDKNEHKVTFIKFGNSLHVQRKSEELCRPRSLLKSFTLNYSANAVNYKNFRLYV